MPHQKRILLVDHEVDFCRLAKQFLEQTGEYVVQVEHSALKAMPVSQEFKPDVILLGLLQTDAPSSVLAAWHDLPVSEKVPIVHIRPFVAIHYMPFARAFWRDPTTGFLVITKPMSYEDLLDCLREALASRATPT